MSGPPGEGTGVTGSDPFDLSDALQVLGATPGVLRSLLSPLGEGWTGARERPDGWSPHEIVAHLIQGEREDWVPRARRLLEHGERLPFEPFDRDGHLDEARASSLAELLDRFERLRGENLAGLERLAVDEGKLGRTGTHPALGAVTLRELLTTWVIHDLAHLAQIPRILAHRWGHLTGPWSHPDYLGILHR